MKLGIGARITAVFGLGALLLSVLLGGISYFTVRHFLLEGRETAAQQTAFSNASLVRSSLESGDTQYVSLLAQIDAGTDAHSVLYHRSKAYVSSLSVNASSIPWRCATRSWTGRRPPRRTATRPARPRSPSACRSPRCTPTYFEVFDLSDLDHTLSVLGAHALRRGRGDHVARDRPRALRQPAAAAAALRRLRAAGAIAGGELDTRLDIEAADPDLVGLTARSTPWSTSSRSASSARRGSTPT